MDHPALQLLLKKEMDRKEFLLYMGSTALALTGVTGILHTLTGSTHSRVTGNGYGTSVYGGQKDTV